MIKQKIILYFLTLFLMGISVGKLKAQSTCPVFIPKPATFVSANKAAIVGNMSYVLDGEGATGLPSSSYGNYGVYWYQSSNPVIFNFNMKASSTISRVKFYQPWGFDEGAKNVTVRLYNGATLLGTEAIVLPSMYPAGYVAILGNTYTNVTKIQMVILDDYNLDPDTPKRTSLTEVVFGDTACTDTDGDAVADYLDLDNDNDGIKDIDENCSGFLAQNTSGVWKGKTSSNLTATLTGATPQTNSNAFSDGQIRYYVNQNGGDPRYYKTGSVSFTYSFSTPVPAKEIAFWVDDIDPSKGATNVTVSFKINGGDPNGNFIAIDYGENPLTYLNYNTITGVMSSPSSGLDDQRLIIKGIGNTLVSTITITNSGIGSDGVSYALLALNSCDKDGDNIPDILDLDSDNDGCLDALEGDENIINSQLVNAGGIVTVGTGSTASNQNLCASGTCVDTNGVPTVVNSGGAADVGGDQGQGIGSSKDFKINSCFVPLVCNDSFYLTQHPSSGTTTLYDLSNNTNPFSINSLSMSPSAWKINGIGYNTVDNYLYGMRTDTGYMNHIVKIDASGTYQDLGVVSGIYVNGGYNAGAFDDAGNYYIIASNTKGLFKVDVTSLTATTVSLSETLQVNDITYDKTSGLFYGYNSLTKKLVSINPISGVVLSIGDAQTFTYIGAMYSDANGNIFGNDDSGTGFYEFNKVTGVSTLISSSINAIGNDGANCVNSIIIFPADLMVTKTDNKTQYTHGTTNTYTVVVSNNGPFGVLGATVSDPLPAGIPSGNVSYSVPVVTGGATTSITSAQTGALNDVVNLPVGGTITYTINITIPSSFIGDLVNVVTVTPPANSIDSTLANNTATDTDSSVCAISATNPDSDGDGISNFCDLDDDNDGILDTIENCIDTTPLTLDKNNISGVSTFSIVGGDNNVTPITAGYTYWLGKGSQDESIQYTFTNPVYSIQIPQVINISGISTTDSELLEVYINGTLYPITPSMISGLNASSFITPGGAIGNTTISDVINFNSININYPAGINSIRIRNNPNGSSGNRNGWEMNGLKVLSRSTCNADVDGDGILNSLDLDSDNDGCPDAIEGGANFTTSDLVSSAMQGGNSGATSGTYNQPVIQNLGNTVGDTATTMGVPTIAGIGQAVGTSQLVGAQDALCCIAPVQPTLSTVTQPTCSISTGSFTITNYNAAYTYTFTPSTGIVNTAGTVTAPAGSYTITATLGNCSSMPSNLVVINSANCDVVCNAVVDDFNVTQSIVPINTSVANDYSVVTGVGILGGERDVALINKTGTLPHNFDIELGYGYIDYAQGSGQKSTLVLQWDGVDNNASALNPVGLGGVSFNNVKSIDFHLTKDIANTGLPITVELYTNAGNASSLTKIFNTGDNFDVSFKFSEFTTLLGSGVDLNNIGAVVLKIDPSLASGSGLDLQINNLNFGCSIAASCYKPAQTTGATLDTNHGITALGRAGADNSNWPMVRKGAWTALEAKTKGFVVNRIPKTADVEAIANPVEGMMVYDEEADCLKIYTTTDGTNFSWKCFNTPACPD